MKNVMKYMLVALTALSFSVANAGELSVTGAAKASYVVTSSDGSAASQEKGKGLTKEEKAAVVESTKAASDVYTPVSGEIIETNQPIVDDPSNVNKDPENNGWFFKIKIKNKSELDTLMNQTDYEKFIKDNPN